MVVVDEMIEFIEREMAGRQITGAVVADGLPCYGLKVRQVDTQKIVWVVQDPLGRLPWIDNRPGFVALRRLTENRGANGR